MLFCWLFIFYGIWIWGLWGPLQDSDSVFRFLLGAVFWVDAFLQYPFFIFSPKPLLCKLNKNFLIDVKIHFGIQVTSKHMQDAKIQFTKATPHNELYRMLDAASDEWSTACISHTWCTSPWPEWKLVCIFVRPFQRLFNMLRFQKRFQHRAPPSIAGKS